LRYAGDVARVAVIERAVVDDDVDGAMRYVVYGG